MSFVYQLASESPLASYISNHRWKQTVRLEGAPTRRYLNIFSHWDENGDTTDSDNFVTWRTSPDAGEYRELCHMWRESSAPGGINLRVGNRDGDGSHRVSIAPLTTLPLSNSSERRVVACVDMDDIYPTSAFTAWMDGTSQTVANQGTVNCSSGDEGFAHTLFGDATLQNPTEIYLGPTNSGNYTFGRTWHGYAIWLSPYPMYQELVDRFQIGAVNPMELAGCHVVFLSDFNQRHLINYATGDKAETPNWNRDVAIDPSLAKPFPRLIHPAAYLEEELDEEPWEYFLDTFTETSDTALESHTSDSGHTYSGTDISRFTAYASTDRLQQEPGETGNRNAYVDDCTPPSANMLCEAKGYCGTGTDPQFGICARATKAPFFSANYYLFYIRASDGWRLGRYYNGGTASPGAWINYDVTWSLGDVGGNGPGGSLDGTELITLRYEVDTISSTSVLHNAWIDVGGAGFTQVVTDNIETSTNRILQVGVPACHTRGVSGEITQFRYETLLPKAIPQVTNFGDESHDVGEDNTVLTGYGFGA